MQQTAQGWLIYRLTSSPGWLGAVAFLSLFPVFFLGLWAGALSDRASRRGILLSLYICAALQAVILSILTVAAVVNVYWIAALALCLGIINAFEIPTRQALVFDLVPHQTLPSAVALNSSAFNISRLVGPLSAGILIGLTGGESICFLINSLTFIPVLLALSRLDLKPKPDLMAGKTLFRSGLDGLRLILSTRELRLLLTLLATLSFFGIWFVSFLPAFVREIFERGPLALGAMVASVGAGSLLGAYSTARVEQAEAFGLRIAISAIVFSLALLTFANLRWFPAALFVLLVLGFAMVTQNVGINTLVQLLAPEEIRGRACSAYTMALLGVGPIGAVVAGMAAETIGISRMLTCSGLACLIGSILCGVPVSKLRLFENLHSKNGLNKSKVHVSE